MNAEKKDVHYTTGLISIIVPVFNVRDYLDRCIKSIVCQSYTNIEIILIDDGSADGSQSICDEWGKRDGRIRVFHKKNGGSSSARNFGLKMAKGEFIGFVDSDDYIADDMYDSLMECMDEDADIVCCGTAQIFPDAMNKQTQVYGKSNKMVSFSNEEAMKELLLVRGLRFAVWDKLYRRELLQGIRFPEGKTCEDYPVTYEILKRSRKTVSSGKVKYFYCYREDSISRQQFKVRRMSYVMFTRDIYKDVIKAYPNERKCAEALFIESVISTLDDIKRSNQGNKYETIQKRLKKFLRRMAGRILFQPYISEVKKKHTIQYIYGRE